MDYDEYVKKMIKCGEWGDRVTLQAAADLYELAGNMKVRMRKFASGLSNDLVLEYKEDMLNKDIDFSRSVGYLIPGEGDPVVYTISLLRYLKNHPGRCIYGEHVCYTCDQSGYFKRDCPTVKGSVEGTKSQENSTAPPPLKVATSATGGNRSQLYALSNHQDAEASPDVVTGML
ncbi:uncharacterized protein LOC124887862 [Capsicum annuum]|uniref:uncharacterized protein LOC124887862 n=1 Tax=Capsicum annuum TaxID=4072 RepID=UPI001FB085AD|nr:uncharacterized protein LOC124887862 [Capsicum annuum]